jgi:hypothetical protein
MGPTLDHPDPFHFARFFVVLLVGKNPAATTYDVPAVVQTVRDRTPSGNPLPNADHVDVVAFHIAILLAETPPIEVNLPPAYTFPFQTARLMTCS